MTCRQLVITAVWQAALAVTLVGSPQTYSSTSYAVLFAVVGPQVHGLIWAASAALSLRAAWGTWDEQRFAQLVAAGLAMSWAVAFIGAWTVGELSGWSGPVTWSYVAARLLRDVLLTPREAPGPEG